MTDKDLAGELCFRLNDLIASDDGVRRAVCTLLQLRLTCPDAGRGLRDHPTLQVGSVGREFAEVGLLGVINGLVGVRPNDWGYIAAKFDDDSGELLGFDLLLDEATT